jgi:hypothetical protein
MLDLAEAHGVRGPLFVSEALGMAVRSRAAAPISPPPADLSSADPIEHKIGIKIGSGAKRTGGRSLAATQPGTGGKQGTGGAATGKMA